VVVQIVVQESTKPLIESQVVDHMEWQACAQGAGRPMRVMVLMLEPLRAVLRRPLHRHIRSLRTSAPNIRIVLVPYISRLGTRQNGRLIAAWLKRWIGSAKVAFHCRNEAAIEWATSLIASIGKGGIVADIRGPRPLEILFSRGYTTLADADHAAADEYGEALARLRRALGAASAVTTVSSGMVEWLTDLGLDKKPISYVPCCVSKPTFRSTDRDRVRRELGISQKLVMTYLGVVAPYQHLGRMVIPFIKEAMSCDDAVHFLGITPNTAALQALLRHAQLPLDRCTVMHVPHRSVAEYLSAGDAGLLVRPLDHLAKVVQPVKLGEYLAAGVPIIVSAGTSAIDTMITASGAGLVTRFNGPNVAILREEMGVLIPQLRSRGHSMRCAALDFCREQFVWSQYTAVVRAAYARAIEAS